MTKLKLILKTSTLIFILFSCNIILAEETGPCSIETMTLELLECNTDGTYDVELYYTVLNPVGDTLSLFINSVHHDDYIIGGSLTIENVEPSDIFDTDIFFLCMKEDEDCYISLDFAQPDCLCDGPCEVEDIQVLVLECDSITNTYAAQIFYTINNPGHEVVHVTINNEYYGTFPVGQTIIIEGITPRPNSEYDIVQICASDECCGEFEYLPVDCEGGNDACDIFDIEIVEFTCSPGGTFDVIWIEYEVINPADSIIHVAVNNNYAGGWIVGEPISLEVPTGIEEVVVTVFFDDVNCTETITFDNICEDGCNWGDIEINGLECLEEEYFATLNYSILDPPFDEVYLILNGVAYGGYPVNEPIQIADLITEVIEVHLYFYSEETDTICSIMQIFDHPCLFNCDTECITAEFEWEYDCYDADPGFYLLMTPFLECATDSINLEVTINGSVTDLYNSAEEWEFEFVPNIPNEMTVQICYADNPDCCTFYSLPAPECDNNNLSCAVDTAMVYLNCEFDNLYYLEGYAHVVNPDNDFIDVFIDDIFAGSYAIDESNFAGIFSDSLLVLEPNTEYEILICVTDSPNCCTTVTAITAHCSNSCECLELTDFVNISTECQANGNLSVSIAVGSLCDTISLQVNGSEQLSISVEGTYTFQNVEAVDEPNIYFCLANSPNCCASIPWNQPQCLGGDDPVEQLFKIDVNRTELVVETEEESSLGLFDTQGRMVRRHGENRTRHILSTTGLTTGVYLVNIIEPTQIRTKKVFISN